MSDLVSEVRAILELGFPAVVLIQIALLWRAYRALHNQHVEDLRAQITTLTLLCTRNQQQPNQPPAPSP